MVHIIYNYVDKYVYHLPEHRQVKQYADMGVKLPASTVNDWMHAVASKLYPLYESLGEQIRSRNYLQIDEVPWRIADVPGKSRKGYVWQFFDATPTPMDCILSQRFAGGNHTPCPAQGLSRGNPDGRLRCI